MSDTISLSPSQFKELLARFAAELDAKGGRMSDSEVDEVASRLLNDLSSTCQVTGSSRVLNSNVAIKIS